MLAPAHPRAVPLTELRGDLLLAAAVVEQAKHDAMWAGGCSRSCVRDRRALGWPTDVHHADCREGERLEAVAFLTAVREGRGSRWIQAALVIAQR